MGKGPTLSGPNLAFAFAPGAVLDCRSKRSRSSAASFDEPERGGSCCPWDANWREGMYIGKRDLTRLLLEEGSWRRASEVKVGMREVDFCMVVIDGEKRCLQRCQDSVNCVAKYT